MKKAPNVTQEGISSVAVDSPFRHAAPDTVGGAVGALNNNHTAKSSVFRSVSQFPDHVPKFTLHHIIVSKRYHFPKKT
ncbi:hypothetical protein WR25_21639 [Diploscapter pachys]|uniref:Uncharacterized protein n=1 Tax=Diploscapter pachys TaxID=2018661 RepID=A0A2A2LL04_9BILA|nr:hypothetical protein WR25_21639 [Diploscapter pachys]